MNQCDSRNIECPYALSDIGKEMAGLPCIGTQEQCDKWQARRNNIGK